MQTELDMLTELIRASDRILVFTGAGISTASGIQDFRGPQGLWKRRQPVYYQDFLASEAARIEHWEYKLEAWPSFKAAAPNAVHEAVADLDRAGKLLACVTQNIDGLHTRAGLPREKIVELHGTNAEIECTSCGERSEPGPHFARFASDRIPPRCSCGGHLKPATISFGQLLREEDLNRAFAAACAADLVVALGSTLSVYPAASIPLEAAERGTPYVIVNRGETEHDGLSCIRLRIEGDVGNVFPPACRDALSVRS